MKRYRLIIASAMFFSAFAAQVIFSGLAEAACVTNQAGQTLYISMKSNAGPIERSIRSGERVCQNVRKGEEVNVNILPFGGARFGCRVELLGEEEKTLTRFGTMNKCRFE